MISVIVPVYNVENYLRRCVDSLLNQDTDQEYEIILVDDGSKDQSSAICDAYQKEYEGRIVVIHKPNGGLSSARNEGVRHARGEWISCVDSDDYVSPQYLSRLYALKDKFNADMAVLSVRRAIEGHELMTHTPRRDDFVLDGKQAFFEIYARDMFGWYAYAKLYRRDAMLKHPFIDGYYEDSATLYSLIDECDSVAFGDYLSEYHYLVREGSIATSKLSEKHYRIFKVCDEIGEYVDSHYPEWDFVKVVLYQNAVLQLINRTGMTDDQFKDIFCRYRPMFRKNVWKLLRRPELSTAKKYYAVILCLTPTFYKLQRRMVKTVLGDKLP